MKCSFLGWQSRTGFAACSGPAQSSNTGGEKKTHVDRVGTRTHARIARKRAPAKKTGPRTEIQGDEFAGPSGPSKLLLPAVKNSIIIKTHTDFN